MRRLPTVQLHCASCRKLHDRPVTVKSPGSFDGAKIAAYHNCVTWKSGPYVVGDFLDVEVCAPFCCRESDMFWLYEDGQLIRCFLKKVQKMDRCRAVLCIRIMDVRQPEHWLTQVDAHLLEALKNKAYDAGWIQGFGDLHEIENIGENTVRTHYTCGGDLNYISYIYTDDYGVDHCYMCMYWDFEESYVYAGDRILGFAKDRNF